MGNLWSDIDRVDRNEVTQEFVGEMRHPDGRNLHLSTLGGGMGHFMYMLFGVGWLNYFSYGCYRSGFRVAKYFGVILALIAITLFLFPLNLVWYLIWFVICCSEGFEFRDNVRRELIENGFNEVKS